MSDLGLHHEFAKVGTVRGGGRYPITCGNVRAPVAEEQERRFATAAPGVSQRPPLAKSGNFSLVVRVASGNALTARAHFTALRPASGSKRGTIQPVESPVKKWILFSEYRRPDIPASNRESPPLFVRNPPTHFTATPPTPLRSSLSGHRGRAGEFGERPHTREGVCARNRYLR